MADEAKSEPQVEGSLIIRIVSELFGSPLNLALLGICSFLIYKIIASRRSADTVPAKEPDLPPLKRQDFTLEQLKEFDGKGADGRVLIAVNGKVFDVTRGKRFYGPGHTKTIYKMDEVYLPGLCLEPNGNEPFGLRHRAGGPYGLFAGHDASRALATFSLGEDALKNEYDDLSDLNTLQMESVREWEMQFQDKYVYVGRLLKPGEQPTDYSDTEDEEKTEADKKVL